MRALVLTILPVHNHCLNLLSPFKEDQGHCRYMRYSLQVLVGSATSEVFHVFELKSILAAFAMFVPQKQPCMMQPGGFATFQIAEAPRRVQSWMQDELACEVAMGPDGCGGAEFLCLRGGQPLAISVGVFLQVCPVLL